MSESQFYLNQIESKLIPERAEAVRWLENYGSLDHLTLLLHHITEDKSPAIRLMAADAFSDIVSRYRTGDEREKLTTKEREYWLQKIMEIPIHENIAVALIIATLDLPQSLNILLTGFRHPHSEVRLASAVGTLRYLQSTRMRENQDYEQLIKAQMFDTSLYSDSVVYLAELCVALNIRSALPLLDAFELFGEHQRLITKAKEGLSGEKDSHIGLWFSDGNDAGEFNPSPKKEPGFLVLHEDYRLFRCLSATEWQEIDADKEVFSLYFRRIGQASSERILQIGDRSYYRCSIDEIDKLLGVEGVAKNYRILDNSETESSTHLEVLAEVLAGQIPEDVSKYWRDLGGIWLRAGHPARALASLETALLGKRTPVDTHFFIGEAHSLLQQEAKAIEAWQYCLSKSRSNRPPHVRWCNKRLEK